MGSQSRSDSAIMGKPMEAYCAPEPTFSHTNTKCCAAHSTCDHTTPYKPVSIPRAVQDVTSTVVGGQASPQRRRGFSNSKHQPLLHMADSWLALDVMRELDEVHALYFALTLHSPSSRYYLVSGCYHLASGRDPSKPCAPKPGVGEGGWVSHWVLGQIQCMGEGWRHLLKTITWLVGCFALLCAVLVFWPAGTTDAPIPFHRLGYFPSAVSSIFHFLFFLFLYCGRKLVGRYVEMEIPLFFLG